MTKLSFGLHLLFILGRFNQAVSNLLELLPQARLRQFGWAVVKRLIRNKKTKAFLAGDGSWSSDPGSAADFYNDAQVLAAKAAYRLRFCELYYCFSAAPSKLDFAFPLSRWVKSTDCSARSHPVRSRRKNGGMRKHRGRRA